jgi:hypothetical protein
MLSAREEEILIQKIPFEKIPKFESEYIKSVYLSKLIRVLSGLQSLQT